MKHNQGYHDDDVGHGGSGNREAEEEEVAEGTPDWNIPGSLHTEDARRNQHTQVAVAEGTLRSQVAAALMGNPVAVESPGNPAVGDKAIRTLWIEIEKVRMKIEWEMGIGEGI